MNMRNLLIIIIAVALAACRANLSERDTDPQTSRARTAERPAAEVAAEKPVERTEESYEAPAAQPNGGAYLAGDGPGTDAPADLHNIPDAVPRAEPLHRYANRPYTVLGKNYTPLTAVGQYKKTGIASWYGKKFHGQKTSIGETYDMYGMTAASTILPIPSYARVTNLANNKSVIVRINDRGPFLHERVIDLSYTAAAKLGIIGSGQGEVEVESLNPDASAPAAISPIYREPVQITPLPSATPAAAGKAYLQLGAFRSQSGAEQFLSSMRTKLSHTGKQLSLSHKNGMVRVRIGPYANADAARATALDMQSMLGFKPMLSLR